MDILLGQTVTLTGEVRTLSTLGLDDKLLPHGRLMVTMLVRTDAEPAAAHAPEPDDAE